MSRFAGHMDMVLARDGTADGLYYIRIIQPVMRYGQVLRQVGEELMLYGFEVEAAQAGNSIYDLANDIYIKGYDYELFEADAGI